jgi:hypothetical protein
MKITKAYQLSTNTYQNHQQITDYKGKILKKKEGLKNGAARFFAGCCHCFVAL